MYRIEQPCKPSVATRPASWNYRRGVVLLLLMALAMSGCFALSDNPPLEPQASGPTGTPKWVIPADNDLGELNDPWRRSAHKRIHACDLLSAGVANRILQTNFDPPEPESLPGRNQCALKVPLSELWLMVWSPDEAQVMEATWQANPDMRLDTADLLLQAAYFHPGTSETPGRSTLDNGQIAITAFANFQFKSHDVWMTLQATGELAIHPELPERLLELADSIDQILECVAQPSYCHEEEDPTSGSEPLAALDVADQG